MSRGKPQNETRCTRRVRKKEVGTPCALCDEPIKLGEAYHELVLVDVDFQTLVAHETCCADKPEWKPFHLTPADRGLKPVRIQCSHRWRVGVAVSFLGLQGQVTGGENGCVLVDLCGVQRRLAPDQLLLQ